MQLCLSCHHLSPSGLYCGHCGRSFGGKLCKGKKRHRNAPDATYCVQCGTTDLTDATAYVPLGWLTLGLAWSPVALVGWGLWCLCPSLSRLLIYGVNYIIYWSLLVGMVYVFLTLIPGEAGKQLRQMFSGTVGLVARQSWKIGQQALGAALRLVVKFVTGNGQRVE